MRTRKVLLATDLHAGNVVRANGSHGSSSILSRSPEIPLTMRLSTCSTVVRDRLDPDGTIRRFADLAGIEYERVRLWTFARAAAER